MEWRPSIWLRCQGRRTAAALLLLGCVASLPTVSAYLGPVSSSGCGRSASLWSRAGVRGWQGMFCGSSTALHVMNSDVGPQAGDEPEGTRVEEALRVTTRQMKALQRLVDGFQEIPSPDDPPAFPPVDVHLAVPSRESVEGDEAMVLGLNQKYYEGLNGRDVKSILSLWKGDGTVQMYANEDKIITGRDEIDKHFDSRFRNVWATNKHKARMNVRVEDERVFLRGINAFVTNKEVWENPITKEKKIMFATKIMTKSNGEWSVIHVHAGDGSQIEVNPNGQMKLTDGTRSLGQQQSLGGRQQQQQQQPPPQQLGTGALGGFLGGGGGGGDAGGGAAGGVGGLGGIVPGESGFTADGREYRTIVTPEGYRIILGSSTTGAGGALGGGGGGMGGRSGQETKEALLKALINDLSKNGRQEIIPLQLGSRGGRGGGGGGELFSGSLDGSRRRSGGEGGREGGKEGEEGLTRKTVEAIRQLCVEGRLTVLQKQKLIFSVIRSTKQEEVSQVEMAYELLVENALAGDESALEEFADQCVMLCAEGGAAHSLTYDEGDSDEEEFEEE